MHKLIPNSVLRLCLIGGWALTASAHVLAADTTPAAEGDGGEKIYKKVGPDGEVIYSDKPTSGSQEIQVPASSGYQPVKPPADFKPYQPPAEPKPVTINNSVTITSPENNTAMWSGGGELNVSVSLETPLTAGQQLEYLVDGKVVYMGTETSYTLSNVFRGTHTLTVRIRDQEGRTITSSPVTFTLHRPTKLIPPPKSP